MLDSITIKNYKAIQSEEGLILKDLKNVNYLVGKNGCGKSSVLEDLFSKNKKNSMYVDNYKYKNLIFILKRAFVLLIVFVIFPLFLILIVYEIISNYLRSSNSVASLFLIIIGFVLIISIIFVTTAIILGKKLNFKNNKLLDFIKEFFIDYKNDLSSQTKSFLSYVNKNRIFYDSVEDVETELKFQIYKILSLNLFNNSKNIGLNKIEFIINNRSDDLKFKSEGEKSVIALISVIFEFIKSKKDIILIDEPEKYLHPDLQKKIPQILNTLKIYITNKQIIVSTHSPFIISEAAKYPDTQKVYLLEDGQTRDLEGNLGLGQEGYSGNACKEVVNKMLGVDTSDFLPSKIVFCEQSLCAFLQIVNARFYNKDLQFKTPIDIGGKDQGGDPFVIAIAELEAIIEKGAKNLLPTNFTIIMDIPNETHLLRKLENIRVNHPDKILTLTTMSFEEKFGQDPKEVSKQIGGKIKNATDKAGTITKEDFETKFAEILKIFNT